MKRLQGALLSLVVATGTGCHLLLDPDQYRLEYDGGPDGGPPDSMLPDVDVQALALAMVEPASAFEGQGSFAGGPGVAILLHGTSIAPDAMLSASGVDGVTVDEVRASRDGTALAAVLRIPVDTTRGEGAPDQTLTLTVTQGGGQVTDSLTMTITSLDELVLTTGANPVQFKERYSTITTSGTITLHGATKARLRATASIVISTKVNANGGTLDTVGAGGCPGGESGSSGGCNLAGGQGGMSQQTAAPGKGGGGGGASTSGQNGGGGATGGMVAGNADLVPIVAGNGGGGGGNGALALGGLGGAGGVGGAGAGTIELTSEGGLDLQLGADVSAVGGTGGTGGGGGCSSGGGGGGGGSGGGLLLRSSAPMTLAGALRATGGPGGPPSAAGCGNGGGAGADGFIRIDAPSAALAGLDAMPTATRGPMWTYTSQVVDSGDVELTLIGSANHAYGYTVGEGAMQRVTTDPAGSIKLTVHLTPRVLTSVCAYVNPDLGDQLALPEAKNCRVLVYIP